MLTRGGPPIHARGRIPHFELAQPHSIAEALRGFDRRRTTRAMAGGIDVLNELKTGADVDRVVHLTGIGALRGITIDRYLTIGAATTHREIERDGRLEDAIPGITAIVQEIGNVRVRAVGTIGGNLMAANRGYDWLPLLMALRASLAFADRPARWYPVETLTGGDGRWRVPRRLLAAIRIPVAQQPRLWYNRELKPVISVAVSVRRDGGTPAARVAIGGMYAAPLVRDLEIFDVLAVLAPGVRARNVDPTHGPEPRFAELAETVAARTAARLPKAHDDGLAASAYRHAMARALLARGLYAVLAAP